MRELYRSASGEAEVRRWCAERLSRWPVAHTTLGVTTSLGTTQLVVAGGGETTCVYLPGTTFNAATSLGVLTALAGQFRVVCADLPGQPGGSTSVRPPEDPGPWGAWVSEVVEHARADHAGPLLLVGHSRGAAMALACPAEAVDALVLASPAGLAPVRLTPTLLARSAAWMLRPTRRRAARVVDLMAGGSPVPDRAVLDEWLTLVARHTRPDGAPGPLPPEVVARWRGTPVKVLGGQHDAFFPPQRLDGPATTLLGVSLEVVPATGHLLPDQRPDRVAAAVGGGA